MMSLENRLLIFLIVVAVATGPVVAHADAGAPQVETTRLDTGVGHTEQQGTLLGDHSRQHNTSTGNNTVRMSSFGFGLSRRINPPPCDPVQEPWDVIPNPCNFSNTTAVDTQSNMHSIDLSASIGTSGAVAVWGFTQQRSAEWATAENESVTVSDEYTITGRIYQERRGSGLDGAATRAVVLTRLTVHDRTTNEIVADRNITEHDLLTPTPAQAVIDTFVTSIEQFIGSRFLKLLAGTAAEQLNNRSHTETFDRTVTRNVSYVAQKGHDYDLTHTVLVVGGGVETLGVLDGIEVDASVNSTIHEVRVAPTPPEAVVSVEPTTDTSMLTGETATYDVVVSNVSAGVGTFTVSLSSTNASVASISNVTLPGSDLDHTVSISPDNATANVTRINPSVNATDGSARLFSVTVDGVQNGTAALEPSVTDLDARPLFWTYEPVATNTTRIAITRPVPPILGTDPPTDLDGDGRLEDTDGDGSGDIADVLAYYNNRDSDVIRTNPDRFDHDADGVAGTVFDALALYEQLA